MGRVRPECSVVGMESGATFRPDWRDSAAYAPLLAADRAILAWEWLRRTPAYRAAAARAAGTDDPSAVRWGLHRFEDPDRAAPLARPFWTKTAFDAVLTAAAAPAGGPPAFDFALLSPLLAVAPGTPGERLLVSDGWRAIRLDLTHGSASAGPVRLELAVAGPPALAAPLAALNGFAALARTGRFSPRLHPPVPRARRHLLVLRTADALVAGAGQRAIAAALLAPEVARIAWRQERPELRLQVQRLVRDARSALAGGYRALLRRP